MSNPHDNSEAKVDTELTYGQVTSDVLAPLFTMGKPYMAGLGLVLLGLAYGGWCIIQQRMQPLTWWCFGRCFFPLAGFRRAGVGQLVAACPGGNTHSIQVVPTNNLRGHWPPPRQWGEFGRSLPRACARGCQKKAVLVRLFMYVFHYPGQALFPSRIGLAPALCTN